MTTGVMISKLQRNGQITIPAAIRENFGLKAGDIVTFTTADDGFFVRPQELIVMGALEAIGKGLREKGITLDELMQSGRDMRGDLIEELYGLSEDKAEE